MAILKSPYEISVWKEILNDDGTKTEKKMYIIGSDNMSYLGKATNVVLKREIKGTNTITFQMPSKFFNSQTGEYEKNEFTDILNNQRKIKVKFKNKYFEFIISKITEDKNFKSIIYSYECNDSFIDELSRTGYNITFDEELYNNVDEIGNFMDVILEDSIWDYRPDMNSGDFTEYNEERFYKIPLSQFSGSLKAYKIKLDIDKIDNNYWGYERDEQGNIELDSLENPIYKKWVEKDGKREYLDNIHNGDRRKLQLGDDLAREQRVFWDNYKSDGDSQDDNGFDLFDNDNIEELSEGYIYVPYSDLTFIYGNLFEEAYKATATPAIYGTYKDNKGIYALQPNTDNPNGLIQILYFKESDKIVIDESGTIMNNDCHYIIKVQDWNDALKDNSVFWSLKLDNYNEDVGKIINESAYGQLKKDGDTYYVEVKASDSIADDYNWKPVYYEGYLNHIGDQDVYAARKLSVTDRTELNKQLEKYVTIYQNPSFQYKGLYSEKHFNENDNSKGYRVSSSEETRIILPTLAENKVANGTKISENSSWSGKTVISTDTDSDTGSYYELIKIEPQNMDTNSNKIDTISDTTGTSKDQSVSDFYLSIQSPYLANCQNLDKIGTISSDIAINFGFTGEDDKLEKDKVYAIRLCTLNQKEDGTYEKRYNTDLGKIIIGEGSVDLNGNYVLSGSDSDVTYKIEKGKEETNTTTGSDGTTTTTTKSTQNITYNYSTDKKDPNYDEHIDFSELYADRDIVTTTYKEVKSKDEDGNEIYENDVNSTYQENNEIKTSANGNSLTYLPLDDSPNIKDGNLSYTKYHTYDNSDIKNWNWSNDKTANSIEDGGFLLFKSPITIEKPYIGIRTNSYPARLNVKECKAYTYTINNGTGVVIAVKDKDDCFVKGVTVGIDKVYKSSVEGSIQSTYSQDVVDCANYILGISNTKPSDTSCLKANLYNDTSKRLKKSFTFSAKTAGEPLYFSAVEFENSDKGYTYPYALYIGDGTNYYFKGFFNFTKKAGEE